MAPEKQDSATPDGWAGRIFRRVLARRCPQCGEGRVLRGPFSMEKSCGTCDLLFRREQGAMTGSMYLCSAVTQLFACLVVLAVFFGTDWGAWTSLAVSAPLVLLFCFWFLPYSRAIWVGVEYWSDLNNGEDWIQPRP